MKPRRVLLIGMMGAGKTTVGHALAARWGWRFVDSDAMVMAHSGLTVAEIFEQRGEAAFRHEETSALQRALGGSDRLVVSVAGGAVLRQENQDLLRAGGVIVWLRARPETLISRVGSAADRPLLREDPKVLIPRILAGRQAVYESLADLVVDVDDRTPADVVAAIIEGVAPPSEGD